MGDEVPIQATTLVKRSRKLPSPTTHGKQRQEFFVMDLETFAYWAQQRWLPQALELLFLRQHGFNPVTALQAEHARRVNRERWLFCSALGFVVFVFYSGVFLWLRIANLPADVGQSSTGFVFTGAATAVFTGSIGSVMIFVSKLTLREHVGFSKQQVELAWQYKNDFWLLLKWSAVEKVADLCLEERVLRNIAKKILGLRASEVLMHRCVAVQSSGEAEIIERVAEGEYFKILQTTLAVLNRLGIADMDLKPYFAEGERILWAKKEKEQSGCAAT